MFKKYRIKQRLTISFIMVAVIASIAAIVGVIATSYVANQYSYALVNYGFSQGDVGKTMVSFADAHSASRAVIGYLDSEIMADALKTHDEKKESCQNYMEALKETLTSPKEIEVYNAAGTAMKQYWELEAKILELGNSTEEERSRQAQMMAANELLPIYEQTYSYLSELMDLNVTTGNNLQNRLTSLQMILIVAIIVIIIVSIALSVMLGNNIAQGIARPLIRLSARLETFAQGRLSEEFPEVEAEDEVADMVRVAGGMAQNLALIIQDAKYRLGEMAGGDYTVESSIADKYVGEFEELHTAINQMNVNSVC